MDFRSPSLGNQASSKIKPLSFSPSTQLSPEHVVITEELSGVKGVAVVDPRWPLLNRWSSPNQLKPSSMESPLLVSKLAGVPSSLVSGQPAVDQQTGDVPSSLVSVQPAVDQKNEASLDGVCHSTMNEAHANTAKNMRTTEVIYSHEDMNKQKETTVSTPLGAWSKPLPILSHSPQHGAEVRQNVEPLLSQWPPLSVGKSGIHGQPSNLLHRLSKNSKDLGELEAQEASLKAQSKEYPWSARMNQSMRNLHRVTIPEYMEDGTPQVRIPSHVLLSGLENQKEFVVGQFYRCLAPTGGQIQAVVTRIWGRKCRIFTRKLGDSTYLFHIPDESTRKWVLQRSLWHVDDCLMFVSPWSPAATISIPEITTVPVWLTLLNIPDQLYSILGIKWIASGIGEPLLTEKPWLDPTLMGKAKILVEVKLDKPFPKRVALIDNSDSVTMVDVSYSWLPTTCNGCGQLGHKASRCLLLNSKTTSAPTITVSSRDSPQLRSDIGKAPIAELLPIVEVEISEKSNTCVSVPVMTSPFCAQETNALIATSPTAVDTHLAKGTLANSVEKLSAAPTLINNFVVTISNETITKEISPLVIQVERPLRKSLSSATLGNNRFSSLDSSEDEEEIVEVDIEPEHEDFLTPAGKRILRERSVKPSAKIKEMQGNTIASGRGNRGRGNRGGRG